MSSSITDSVLAFVYLERDLMKQAGNWKLLRAKAEWSERWAFRRRTAAAAYNPIHRDCAASPAHACPARTDGEGGGAVRENGSRAVPIGAPAQCCLQVALLAMG